MFTAEIRINGGIVGVLHVQNKGATSYHEQQSIRKYDYEYYEPTIGVVHECAPVHKTGSVIVDRTRGLSAILGEIFTELGK